MHQPPNPHAHPDNDRIEIAIPGIQDAVPACLAAVLDGLGHVPMPDENRERFEMVLAEVLNNIVEHAYADRSGPIQLRIAVGADGLRVHVRDEGVPLANAEIPSRRPIDPADLDLESLPEGGFGWFLIRTNTTDLVYRRRSGQNELSFRMPGFLKGEPDTGPTPYAPSGRALTKVFEPMQRADPRSSGQRSEDNVARIRHV